MIKGQRDVIVVGEGPLTIEDIVAVSRRRAGVTLSTAPEVAERIDRAAAFLEQQWHEHRRIYGVTTGYGNSSTVEIPAELVAELPRQLVRFHGCGLGAKLGPDAGRAVMAVRLASLARGFSGVRRSLLQTLCDCINNDIVPVIPEEGSVGASGDLTPLSYLAAALMGERDVYYRGERMAAAAALSEAGLEPAELHPKEALSIMNGTSAMTALACLAYQRAEYAARLAARLTSMTVLAVRGNRGHYVPRLFAAKPQPGPAQAAAWINSDLMNYTAAAPRLQERYSLRCAPHVIGVLIDSLSWIRSWIETEINSSNDNPIIDADEQQVLHGGHFYGGHIAFAMDALKNAVANIADLLDRQLALLMEPQSSSGLPSNLSGAPPERTAINHGFKAVQIAASAWTAEALKGTTPASIFSRSTECHNQDKVSMGTIAARDALRVLQLTEQVSAASLLATLQALRLRYRGASGQPAELSPQMRNMYSQLESRFSFIEEDRELEDDLARAVSLVQSGAWELYTDE